jgi:hypothetical protein
MGSYQSTTLMGGLRGGDPVLLLVVWTLKREVRAIRGCLGTYRR